MIVDYWLKATNMLLGDNADMEFVSSENITVCKFDIKNPVELANHVHENEQITIVIDGEMIIEYGEVSKTMKQGDVCIIPGNVPHKANIIKTPFKSFDIFNPAREDYLKNIDCN